MPDLSYAFLTSLTDGQLTDLDEEEFFLDSFLKFVLNLKWNIPILQVIFYQDPHRNCQHILKEQIVGHVKPSRETGRWLWCKTGQFRLCSGFRGCVNFYCILNFN